MGEDTFLAMMQDYYRTFMFKEAKTEDFLFCVHKYAPNNKDIEDLIHVYLKLK